MLRRVLCTVASLACFAPTIAFADEPVADPPAPTAATAKPPGPIAALPPEQVGPATVEPDPRIGIYTRIELAGFFPLAHSDTVEDGSVYGKNVPREGSGLFGGNVGVRVGYSLGQIGVEGFLHLAYDHSAVAVQVAPGRTDNWLFHRPGGTLGAAGRWLPKIQQLGPVQPTVGLGFGLSGRSIGFTRQVSGSKDKANFQFCMAPTVALDAGVMIGKVPGGRIFIGIQMLIDLASTQTLPSANSKDGKYPIPAAAKVQTSTSPEVFLGPVFGLVLGH